LLVVTHDRYFLERVCDVSYALLGDGSCVLLPGGVDQYLQMRRDPPAEIPSAMTSVPATPRESQPVTLSEATRQARKDLARLEQQIARLDQRIAALHEQMTTAASDYQQLAELQRETEMITANKDELELAWLEAAETAG
jgi:ATPase subunit of ABC transporter with duplicated ATPase domains